MSSYPPSWRGGKSSSPFERMRPIVQLWLMPSEKYKVEQAAAEEAFPLTTWLRVVCIHEGRRMLEPRAKP